MPRLKEREYREMPLMATRAKDEDNESYIVDGYAVTFEPYVLYEYPDGEKIYELFSAECFKDCDMSDVIFQYNHEGRVFARQSNNTLKLDVDEHGLKVEADLGSTSSSRSMYEDIESGLVTKMSWGFVPGEYYFERKTRTIVHTKVKKIFDVSAVSIPANADTNINARSFADGVIGNMIRESDRAESKKKLELLLLLNEEN